MALFVDASAVVAMLTREPDARALTRIFAVPPICDFGPEWAFKPVTIDEREDDVAFEAFRVYGKGNGQPARLDMGDCFADARAETNEARLLNRGDDFARTYIA